jgi:hypothetical protein
MAQFQNQIRDDKGTLLGFVRNAGFGEFKVEYVIDYLSAGFSGTLHKSVESALIEYNRAHRYETGMTKAHLEIRQIGQ